MKNDLKIAQMIFGLVFPAVIIGFSAANLVLERNGLAEEVKETILEEGLTEPKEIVTALDEILDGNLLGRNALAEAYGSVQLLLGKQEDNAFDTVKDKAGYLYSGNFWNGFGPEQKEWAVRVRRLHDSLEKSGTELGVVIYPRSMPEKENRCYGIPYEDYQELTEDFIGWLRYYGVPFLDLCDFCEMSGMTHEDAFFRTDHHWTPEAAFEGYVRIVDFLNTEFQAGLDPEHVLRNPESYKRKTYENVMLGSMGRAAGVVWAGGMEDFTAVYPCTEGNYTLRWGNMQKQKTLEGGFTETLLDINALENPTEDIYSGMAENAYLQSGVSVFTSVINHDAEDAGKLLLIRDSFSTPVGAFLAQSFSQVDMVWNIEIAEEELSALLEENHYDYVLVAIYTSNLSADAFPFGMKGD